MLFVSVSPLSSAQPEIIASGPQENHAWLIREDDAVGEMRRVHDLRTAEAPVNHVVGREIFREGFPEADSRRTDEQKPLSWRRIGAVHLLIGGDVLLPFAEGVGAFSAKGGSRVREGEQGNQKEHGMALHGADC